jgi:hypothetical protein
LKQLLIKLVAAFGLVPAGRYRVLVATVEELRSSAHTWKARAHEAQNEAKACGKELQRHARLVKEARAAAERGGRDSEFARLEQQLVDTERELILAREHLMAVEVKLDILEGAANVLDARLRTAARQQRAESGAAV